ncbi:transglycosylase domain-containing protein [Desulfovibrio sp. OttesenSCG-928-G15]|nr:transglycosylase domain-containing protein [Desulfovibrio sp. OttesenSCG-928-G15]
MVAVPWNILFIPLAHSMRRKILKILLATMIVTASAFGGLYAYCTKDMPPMDVFRDPAKHARLLETKYPLPQEGSYNIQPLAYEEIPKQIIDIFLESSNPLYFSRDGHEFGCLNSPVDHLIKLFGTDFIRSRYLADYHIRYDMIRLLRHRLAFSLDKQQILCAYLNTIQLPDDVFGINAGARYFFNKDAKNLTLAESVTLMLLEQTKWMNRETVSSNINTRRDRILKRLLDADRITLDAYDSAVSEKINVPAMGIVQ